MSDLAAFLNARLDEDEAAAKALAGEVWTAFVRVGGEYNYGIVKAGAEVIAQCGTTHFDDSEARTAHIVRHDPARVLREVEAMRAILAEWEDADTRRYDLPEGVSEGRDFNERERDDAVALTMDAIVAHLAAVYRDHPDYQQEWAPIG